MSEPPKGLYPKLAEAIAEVDRISKDGTNEHFNYSYTSAEQVYRVIRGPLLDRGLLVVPSVDTSEHDGKTTVTRLHLMIVDSETGDKHEAFWMGEGQDSGDKGPYKAATGGMKTWLKHLFMLPADDDPEADSSTDRPQPATPLERLAAVADEHDVPPESRQAMADWLHPDGKPDEARIDIAIGRIRSGELTEFIAEIKLDATKVQAEA